MHPDKNCKFLAPCLLVLTFAMLPDFYDQALSQEGVGLGDNNLQYYNNMTSYDVITYNIIMADWYYPSKPAVQWQAGQD